MIKNNIIFIKETEMSGNKNAVFTRHFLDMAPEHNDNLLVARETAIADIYAWCDALQANVPPSVLLIEGIPKVGRTTMLLKAGKIIKNEYRFNLNVINIIAALHKTPESIIAEICDLP